MLAPVGMRSGEETEADQSPMRQANFEATLCLRTYMRAGCFRGQEFIGKRIEFSCNGVEVPG
jgi:hypothetical protein